MILHQNIDRVYYYAENYNILQKLSYLFSESLANAFYYQTNKALFSFHLQ